MRTESTPHPRLYTTTMVLIAKTARDLYIAQARRQIFGTAVVADNSRSARKYLKSILKGPKVVEYYKDETSSLGRDAMSSISPEKFHKMRFKDAWHAQRKMQKEKGQAGNLVAKRSGK